MSEQWIPVVGYEGLYEVSNLGSVRSLDRTVIAKASSRAQEHRRTYNGAVIPQYSNNNGRPSVNLHKNNKHQAMRVCRLVLGAFIGECPDGMECLHWDGDSKNNLVENLRWGTREENCADMLRHGTRLRGESHPHSKLSNWSVQWVKTFQKHGFAKQTYLAEIFDCNISTISSIKHGRSWVSMETR